MNGGLIVFEGSDGTGKSSLSASLVAHFQSIGKNVLPASFPGRSDGTIGKAVYDIHHDMSAFGIEKIDPSALQCLHIAAHLDAINNRILPAVANGSLVILDRYWWSTLVYGVVGGANRNVLRKLIAAEVAAWDWLKPQALFLVDREIPLRPEPSDLWNAWRGEYLALAKEEAGKYPIHVVTNNLPQNVVLTYVCKLLAKSE